METFAGNDINITTEGRKHLSAALGSRSYLEQYVGGKVEDWVRRVWRSLQDLSHRLVIQHSHLGLDIGGLIL